MEIDRYIGPCRVIFLFLACGIVFCGYTWSWIFSKDMPCGRKRVFCLSDAA